VRWYPELVHLSTHPVEEVRNTDAWVMGQDPSGQGFHEALAKMLQDTSPMVRGNAALSLVRFGDASGRAQIVALLEPVHIVAPFGGHIIDADRPGTAIHQGGIVAKLSYGFKQRTDLRSPISGRIHSLAAETGASVAAGEEIAVVDPGDEQVWEALRALYIIGRAEDLPAIRPYERESRDIPDRIREQALLADQAIHSRAAAQP
jgi:biotin carboxyl carrier protein